MANAPGITPGGLVNVDGTLFYGDNGLYKSDGTATGTVFVSDAVVYVHYYGGIINANGVVYFTKVPGRPVDDGWANRTVAVGGPSTPFHLTAARSFLPFAADDGTSGVGPRLLGPYRRR